MNTGFPPFVGIYRTKLVCDNAAEFSTYYSYFNGRGWSAGYGFVADCMSVINTGVWIVSEYEKMWDHLTPDEFTSVFKEMD